jgi:diguanylate cyclase (GGDEF)-like protein/PAS domain S-box-containing protein
MTLTVAANTRQIGLRLANAAVATSRCVTLADATRPDTPLVFVNAAFTNMTGYTADDAIGRNCRFLQGPDTDPRVVREIHEAVAAGVSIRREILNYRKNGEAFWNDLTIDPIRSRRGQLIGFIGVQFDASKAHNDEIARSAMQQQIAAITRNAAGYVFQRVLRSDGRVDYTFVSPSLNRILGLSEDTSLLGGHFFDFVHPEDRERFMIETRRSAADLSDWRGEIRLIAASGAELWFRTYSSARRLPNGETVWDGLSLEITDDKHTRDNLDFVSRHDILTGLANRFAFKSAFLKQAAALTDTSRRLALFHLDLCAFGDINDARGEAFGDKVLRRFALRLTEFAERMGSSASRLGGDEFGLLLSLTSEDATSADIGQALCAEISRPMSITGNQVVVDICVGVAEHQPSQNGRRQEPECAWGELVKRAQHALNAARQNGPGTCRVYSPEADDRLMNRSAIQRHLRRAIDEEQFEVHYQPIVDLASGAIVGAEALLRWFHPELGPLRPDIFIPIAEATRLIVPLETWVTKTVMRQAVEWQRHGLPSPRLAINLSSVRLQHAGFLESVETALRETGAQAADFEFELTETVLIETSPDIQTRMSALKSLGFTIAIDDFGTGHSSFSYLRRFPVDKIKIDQTFVRQMVAGSADETIVKSMIALGRSLNLEVVAEGIETARQRDFLLEEGLRVGQGYLFSMPLKPEDFSWLLEGAVSLPLVSSRLDSA